MRLSDRINLFVELGKKLEGFDISKHDQLERMANQENPWFTRANIQRAIDGVAELCNEQKLRSWISTYDLENEQPKKVGLVLAGNIPMVGFHDLLCVILSGHHAMIKLSSQDSILMKYLLDLMVENNASALEHFTIIEQLKDYEAVIATGSDNTSRYFEYYFREKPNIIRKNRTSVALLTGDESDDQLRRLGEDVFSYFGMGCRNVTKLFIPEEYDMVGLLDIWQSFGEIGHHNKYCNNYDYHKSIFLINKEAHLDTGFALLKETEQLVAPLSVIYYERYQSISSALEILEQKKDKIQCIVSTAKGLENTVGFGEAQTPQPWDYADGVDTLAFLSQLN